MHVIVLMKLVPDVVEELEIAADGRSLDREFLRVIPNESDEHALEQALLLKERSGARVSVLSLDAPGIDEVLFTALAKGADHVVKVTGGDAVPSTRVASRLVASVLASTLGAPPAELILTGAQANDDLDGLTAPLVAHHLGWPYLGIVTAVRPAESLQTAIVIKELPGGVRGEFETTLPAVLGIQSAERPPRYVPVAKVRAAMKSQRIDSIPAPELNEPARFTVLQMARPEASEHAEMLEGEPEAVAGKVCEILAARGLL